MKHKASHLIDYPILPNNFEHYKQCDTSISRLPIETNMKKILCCLKSELKI